MSLEHIEGTCNLPATLVTLLLQLGIWLVLLWSLAWGHIGCWGILWFFQKATSESAWKTQNSATQLLMPHELTHEQNRVAVVNSVITKILNLELQSRYFDPITPYTTTIQQSINIVQRHLCLSIGSQRPITVDIEGFPGPISPYGFSRWQTCTILSSAGAGAILYLGTCSSKLVENLLNRMFGARLLQDFDN
jgi:hypothetical protein